MSKASLLALGIILSVFVMIGCEKKAAKEDLSSLPDMVADNEAVSVEDAVDLSSSVTGSGQAMPSGDQMVQTMSPQTTPIPASGFASPDVKQIQTALHNAGFYQGKIDGTFGPKTKKAVKGFQTQNGLSADGKVGPKTWTKLSAYLNTGIQETTTADTQAAY